MHQVLVGHLNFDFFFHVEESKKIKVLNKIER